MESFLLEVYDLPDLDSIDLEHIVNKQLNNTLDYQVLFQDENIHKNLCFCWVWKRVFGVYPSKVAVHIFASCVPSADFASIHAYLQAHTFCRFLPRDQYVHLSVEFDAYKQQLQSVMTVKEEIIKKLHDRFNVQYTFEKLSNVSLYTIYQSLVPNGEYYKEQKEAIQQIKTNPLVNTQHQHTALFSRFKALNVYECISHIITEDYFLMRMIWGNNILVVKEGLPDVVTRQVIKSLIKVLTPNGRRLITIMSNPPSNVFNLNLDSELFRALPRVFNKTVHVTHEINSLTRFSQAVYIFTTCTHDVQMEATTVFLQCNEQDIVPNKMLLLPCITDTWIMKGLDSIINVYLQGPNPFGLAESYYGIGAYSWAVHSILTRLVNQNGITKKLKFNVGARNSVVLIDSRPNILSVISIVMTVLNIDPHVWTVTVMTSIDSATFYKECLGSNISIITLPALSTMPFTIDDYNTVMKCPNTWNHLQTFDHVLIIQDDGMLLRQGVENLLYKYDYVGAPWPDLPVNNPVKRTNKDLVGNGGLSLRVPRIMYEIANRYQGEAIELFNNGLQPIPEDIFYAIHVPMHNGRIAPRNIASEFSTEQIYSNTGSLGIHKPWAYLPLGQVKQLMKTC